MFNIYKKAFLLKLKLVKKLATLSLYRSSSQSQDGFEIFTENLELNLENLVQRNRFSLMAIGDFNAKSSNWLFQEKTSSERHAEYFTFHFGLHQVIKKPTHISDTSSLCFDLIFTSQTNLVIDTGVHLPPLLNFHYQIISVKYNLKTIYPPLYVRGV